MKDDDVAFFRIKDANRFYRFAFVDGNHWWHFIESDKSNRFCIKMLDQELRGYRPHKPKSGKTLDDNRASGPLLQAKLHAHSPQPIVYIICLSKVWPAKPHGNALLLQAPSEKNDSKDGRHNAHENKRGKDGLADKLVLQRNGSNDHISIALRGKSIPQEHAFPRKIASLS